MYLFISLVLFKALPISKYRFPPKQTCKVLYPTITRELFINYVTIFKGGRHSVTANGVKAAVLNSDQMFQK